VIVNSLAGSTSIIGGRRYSPSFQCLPNPDNASWLCFLNLGIIYILLCVFVVYQALPSQHSKAFQSKIGWLFVLSSIAIVVWLFLWQFELLTFSIFVMFLLPASLISIYFRVGIGKRDTPPREKLAVYVPFSVYL